MRLLLAATLLLASLTPATTPAENPWNATWVLDVSRSIRMFLSQCRYRLATHLGALRAMSRVLSLLIAGAGMTVAADSLQAAGVRDGDRTYPMDRAHWQTTAPIGWAGRVDGVATFARDEGIPTGTMTLNEGVATLGEGTFAQGQIDFDIKPLGYSDAGIIFRRRGDDDGEFVYVRANPDCPAAQDCVQYAPVTHGLMGWNIYPNYQASAPINATGWNHLTIRVAGDRMQVFVNHAAEPVLTVPRLLGLTSQGGIALKGPAVYANLIVRSGLPPDRAS